MTHSASACGWRTLSSKLKKPVQVYDFKYLPHGVLNLAVTGGMKAGSDFLTLMINCLKKLM